MYLSIVGTLTVLLLYQKPLVLSAKAIPDVHKRAFSDGGNFVPHQGDVISPDDEERIVEELIRSADGKTQGDAEIDLARPSEFDKPKKRKEPTDDEAPSTDKRNTDQQRPAGEIEFAEFSNPNRKPDLRLVDKPVVEVKRTAAEDLFPARKPGFVTKDLGDNMFVATITACVVAAVFGLVVAGVVFRKIHKQHEAAREASYPQYGGTGPAIEKKAKKSPTASGDANLAYSAQLHHFNQTKQKIISTETSQCDARGQESDDSEAEGEEGDYSVYECPGLAPTGDIEVSNPLFENASPKNKDAPENLSGNKAQEGD